MPVQLVATVTEQTAAPEQQAPVMHGAAAHDDPTPMNVWPAVAAHPLIVREMQVPAVWQQAPTSVGQPPAAQVVPLPR